MREWLTDPATQNILALVGIALTIITGWDQISKFLDWLLTLCGVIVGALFTFFLVCAAFVLVAFGLGYVANKWGGLGILTVIVIGVIGGGIAWWWRHRSTYGGGYYGGYSYSRPQSNAQTMVMVCITIISAFVIISSYVNRPQPPMLTPWKALPSNSIESSPGSSQP